MSDVISASPTSHRGYIKGQNSFDLRQHCLQNPKLSVQLNSTLY